MRTTHVEMFVAVVFATLIVLAGTSIKVIAANPDPAPAPAVAAAPPSTPAVRAARMERLRAATLAVIVYVNQNDNHFPNDLGASLPYADEKLGARAYLTPDDERKAKIPDHASAAWVNEHTSFVYLANSAATWKTLSAAHANTPEFPLAVEKFEGHEGRDVAVAFIDGHAEMMAIDKARKLMEDAKKIYSKL